MTTIRPAVASVSALPLVDPRRRGPACPGLISFAGAVGTATGLSLRSPRTVKIFSGTRALRCRLRRRWLYF
jgi:hypothetical protein